MNRYRIGIDLGGTKIEAVLLDPQEKELYRHRIPTPRGKTYSLLLNTVCNQVKQAAGKIPANYSYTVGVGLPGTMDRNSNAVHKAGISCLIGRHLKKDMEKQLGLAVSMENDANCFTYVEALKGAGKGINTVLGVIMGTGCGGGICINGKIHDGLHGIAGEWGHVAIDPSGRKCYCGNIGCVETKISGTGVEAAFFEAFGESITMKDIVEGYRENDARCKKIFMQFIDDFGRVFGGIISMFDPDALVLGGGLSNIDELYTLGADKISQYAYHDNITTKILKNRLGDSAGALGAALL
jgi:fructokinase